MSNLTHHGDTHRPYPRPDSPWLMEQTWKNLLFAHWPVPVDVLEPMIPDGLTLDTFEEEALIGFIPFQISGHHVHSLPSVPGTSAFPEANVRTYVVRDGKPGVYFFSLDAGHKLTAALAKRFFHLPYHHAQFDIQVSGDNIQYRFSRIKGKEPLRVDCTYRPTSDVFHANPGSRESWMTDRYCLYTSYSGTIFRCEIDHAPWPLQTAEAEFRSNNLFSIHGFPVPNVAPLLHFSKQQEAHIWPLVEG